MAIEEAVDRVLALAGHLGKASRQCVILVLLMDGNIPEKNVGFEYLKRAILLLHDDPTMIIKEIYQRVGDSCPGKVDARTVEQSIRQAITAALKNNDRSAIICYFSRGKGGILKKPTNAEFIAKMARMLEMYMGLFEKETENER